MLHSLLRSITVALSALTIPFHQAGAQCLPAWQPGPLNFENIDGVVSAMWAYDPPGSDPLMLFVGGTFRHIGGLTVQNIAAWDGTMWRAVGNGLSYPVRTLIVYNNLLVAGGDFPGHVAFWNGGTWSYPSGGPIDGNSSNPFTEPISVYALAVHEGQLWAGGRFTEANSEDADNIAVLDPLNNQWDAVSGIGNQVNALQVFDPDGAGAAPAQLYAGSTWASASSRTIHRWNGTSWTSLLPGLNGGPNGSVYTLTVTNQGLIVGGSFSLIDDLLNPISAHCIAGYNGTSWFTLGSGCGDNHLNEGVTSLRAFGSDLIVAGKFNDANGAVVNNLVKWNGSSYSAMGGGINSTAPSSPVGEMRVFNGELYIGGGFLHTDGNGVESRNLVRWISSGFLGLPLPWAQVLAAAPWAGRIVFGGSFAHSNGVSAASNTHNLMFWNGANTSGFGTGVNAAVRAVRALPSVGEVNFLAAGGDFTTAGGAAVNRVAKWSQSDTNPLQNGWSPMSGGLNNSVYTLETGYGGVLIAGGLFTSTTHNAVPLALGYMARWNGTQWLKFATAGGNDMNGIVRAIKVYSVNPTNPLANVVTVAGGDFTTANGGVALRIAQWIDNPQAGTTPWAPMGTGFNNTVFAIERHNISGLGNNIYAAGAFTADGNNQLAFNRIARWSGSAWFAVGNGLGFNGPVYALRSFGGYPYAAGAFTSVDGVAANRVARYGGSPAAWSEVAGGLDGAANVLTIFQTELMVGGVFEEAGIGSMETGPTARLLASGAPWLTQQPASQTLNCPFGLSAISVTVAPGYDNLTYQWRRNGVPLVDGYSGTGSVVTGATGSALHIQYADYNDAGTYDCVVTSPCGSVTSAAGQVLAGACCIADTNDDDQVSVTDLLKVINQWGACQDCYWPTCRGDITGDCQVNVTDLLAVINAWGPCP